MTQPAPTQQEFHYQRVELSKAKTLGVGSYGAVCKAKCDELPCAAKILHPIMFQFNDPGALAFLRKFEQECRFLRTIKHPKIVQYVATSQDPETGLPVLLMELMDESLTNFLERTQQPLPYHTQIDLCHDIALALAYLHSNGIIHRDLSSNNVLLIAGSRAKVTDFGMSKLIDTNPRMTPLTKCPGTVVYMSPEALRNPPVYTEKLDCFSEGVLIIQIITRQFPDPGSDFQIVEDPRFRIGKIHVPVPETERRQSHITLIDPTHPLLPISLRCLEYNEEDRPSAQELCHSLATLKEAPAYAQSVQQAQEKVTQANTGGGERQIGELERQLQTKTQQIQTLQQQVQEKDAAIAERDRDNWQLRQETTQQLQEKDRALEAKERKLRELNQQLHTNEQVAAEFQLNLLRKEREVTDVEQRLSEKERLVQQLQLHLRIGNDSSTKQKAASGRGRKSIELKWKHFDSEYNLLYGQSTVEKETVYLRGQKGTGRELVLACDSKTEKWSELPQCPHEYFALATVSGLLTAIGGKDGDRIPTNKLLSLTREGRERKWEERFPPMPSKRYWTTALCTGRHVLVAGGKTGTLNAVTNEVEVMNTRTLQWTTASSLPHPVYLASATLCGDDVYQLGGYHKGQTNRSVFKCALNALLQSRDTHQVWQKVADLPVTYSASATLDGCLLAIGGEDSIGKKTTAIHEYSPDTNSWKVVDRTPTPCSYCAVAVLPGNKVMIANYKKVQIGTLQ